MPDRYPQSCPHDLLEQSIVLNKHHLERPMSDYVRYSRDDRTYLGLNKPTPIRMKAVVQRPANAKVSSMPRLGGVHHGSDFAAEGLTDLFAR